VLYPESGTPDFAIMSCHEIEDSVTDEFKGKIESLSIETISNLSCIICVSRCHKLFYFVSFVNTIPAACQLLTLF